MSSHVDYTQSTQLTELELKILQQYQALSKRLDHLNAVIQDLVSRPTAQLTENLRVIESKVALVFTLFKASVYSLFLQQEGADEIQQEYIESLQESTKQSFQQD
jgi:DASH complex subunit DAD3